MHFQAPGATLSVSLSSLLPRGDLKVVCYPASSRRSPGSFVSGSRATAPPPPTPCIARLLERPLCTGQPCIPRGDPWARGSQADVRVPGGPLCVHRNASRSHGVRGGRVSGQPVFGWQQGAVRSPTLLNLSFILKNKLYYFYTFL